MNANFSRKAAARWIKLRKLDLKKLELHRVQEINS